MLRCFDAQIRPLLSYGAEVWGPDAIWEVLGNKGRQRVREWQRWNQRGGTGATGENAALLGRWGKWVRSTGRAAGVFERALADPMVEVQKIFLRRVVGASLPPNRQLFAETSQLPLHHFWAQQVFGFWKRLSKQPSTLARAVLEEDISAWLESDRSSSEHEYFWAGKVLRILGALGYDYRQHVSATLSNADKAKAIAALEIPFDKVLEEFRQRLLLDWNSSDIDMDPRVFPEFAAGDIDRGKPGVTVCRYSNWMGVAYAPDEHTKKLRACMPRKHHTTLMRFRLGCWDLDVSRFARRPRKPRVERTCRVCRGDMVEDEFHVLMECPVYEPLRRAVDFPTGQDMQVVMTTWDQVKLGNLLAQIQRARTESLRE